MIDKYNVFLIFKFKINCLCQSYIICCIYLATASYRLLPVIQLIKPVRDEDADLLKSCFSPGVIEVVEHETNSGQKYREAHVKNARYDSCSRNIYRYDQLKNCVEMSRIKDHFICKYK